MRILIEHPDYEQEEYDKEIYDREIYDRGILDRECHDRKIYDGEIRDRELYTGGIHEERRPRNIKGAEGIGVKAGRGIPVRINGSSLVQETGQEERDGFCLDTRSRNGGSRKGGRDEVSRDAGGRDEVSRGEGGQNGGGRKAGSRRGSPRREKKTREKIWNSQTGQLWLVLLLLIAILAVLIPFWAKGQRTEVTAQETIRVLMPSGEVCTMAMEDYLVGVVAAEMPVIFAEEALKAQAVASRTFAARRMAGARADGGAYDVDTTSATQVWRSEEQLRERWGADYERNRAKIAGVVRQTAGQVLMFDQGLATTVFFSNTGRLPTESSNDVWGGSLSYLSSVSSPESEETEGYVRRKSMRVQEFLRALKIHSVNSVGVADLKVLERTTAGRIARISVAGQEIKGTDFRKALGLASTDVEWEISGGQICLTTYGYGHGVGLSQYGAQNMALQGQGYEAILAHYYQGTQLSRLSEVS